MADAVKDIVVKIVAQKEGFDNIDSAASSISRLTGVTDQAAAANVSFTDRITKSAASLESIGEFGHTAMSILDRLDLTEMSLENANNNLTNAQLRYNSALEKFGAGSQEAIIAGNNLEKAQNMVSKANIRAGDSYAMIGLTAVGMIPSIVKFGEYMKTTLFEVEVATGATTLKIHAMVPELLLIGAAVGGAYYVITKAADEAAAANKLMTDRMALNYDNAKTKVDELIAELKILKGINTDAKSGLEQENISYASQKKAIEASTQSPDEKKASLNNLEIEHAKNVADINLKGIRDLIALKTGELAAVDEKLSKDPKNIALLQEKGSISQNLLKEKGGLTEWSDYLAMLNVNPGKGKTLDLSNLPAPNNDISSYVTPIIGTNAVAQKVQGDIEKQNAPLVVPEKDFFTKTGEVLVDDYFLPIGKSMAGLFTPTPRSRNAYGMGFTGGSQTIVTNINLDGEIVQSIVKKYTGVGINTDGS